MRYVRSVRIRMTPLTECRDTHEVSRNMRAECRNTPELWQNAYGVLRHARLLATNVAAASDLKNSVNRVKETLQK